MRQVSRRYAWFRNGGAAVVALALVGSTACSGIISSPATSGPTVQIDDEWTVEPPSVVQPSDRFSFVVDNSLDEDVGFVLLRMDYGEVVDLPLADGVVDVSQQVVYDGEEPVVAFGSYPEFGGGTGWEPWSVAAGSSTTVTVGSSLGGGEPGRFAVVSHRPGAIEEGDYVVFDMTDENGEVPQFTLEDFFPTEDEG